MINTTPKITVDIQDLIMMKKVQRSFAVEYKTSRRKVKANRNSIWGDMDLKGVAQDLQDEAMPFLAVTPQVSSSEKALTGKEQVSALLTPPITHETNGLALQETRMADENNAITEAYTPAVTAPDGSKKERKPRARKAVPETSSVQPAAAGKPKRARKAKSDEGATSAKRAPVKRAPKALPAAAPSPGTVDEFADLLQLEEENQRLRKLLAEKLRAENADLRKRLNLD